MVNNSNERDNNDSKNPKVKYKKLKKKTVLFIGTLWLMACEKVNYRKYATFGCSQYLEPKYKISNKTFETVVIHAGTKIQ